MAVCLREVYCLTLRHRRQASSHKGYAHPLLRHIGPIPLNPFQVLVYLPTCERLDLNRHPIHLPSHPDAFTRAHLHIPKLGPEALGLGITDNHRQPLESPRVSNQPPCLRLL